MELRYQAAEAVRIERQGDYYIVRIGERSYRVTVDRIAPGELTFSVDGQRYHAHTATDQRQRYVAFDARVYTFTRAEGARQQRAARTGDASLAATMNGQVVAVSVSEGEQVTRGQTLVVLEAMKMEIRVTAPHQGRVARLLCSPGQVVERGQPLVELAAE